MICDFSKQKLCRMFSCQLLMYQSSTLLTDLTAVFMMYCFSDMKRTYHDWNESVEQTYQDCVLHICLTLQCSNTVIYWVGCLSCPKNLPVSKIYNNCPPNHLPSFGGRAMQNKTWYTLWVNRVLNSSSFGLFQSSMLSDCQKPSSILSTHSVLRGWHWIRLWSSSAHLYRHTWFHKL